MCIPSSTTAAAVSSHEVSMPRISYIILLCWPHIHNTNRDQWIALRRVRIIRITQLNLVQDSQTFDNLPYDCISAVATWIRRKRDEKLTTRCIGWSLTSNTNTSFAVIIHTAYRFIRNVIITGTTRASSGWIT